MNHSNVNIPPYDIVAVGETMLRLSPQSGERLADMRSLAVHVAGSESNILSHVAQLGGKTVWISSLPESPIGRHIANELRRYGITCNVEWAPGESRAGTFYAETTPHPAGPNVVYDRTSTAFSATSAKRYDLSAIGQCRALLITGITPALGQNPRELLYAAIEAASVGGTPIAFDVNYRSKLWSRDDAAPELFRIARRATVIFCTANDAAELWDVKGEPADIVQRLAERFSLSPCQRLVVTLGAEGAIEWNDGAVTTAKSYASEGAHRFGSGDAFAGGYITGWLGLPAVVALNAKYGVAPLQLGCAVAALKRCTAGDMAGIHIEDFDRVFGEMRFR